MIDEEGNVVRRELQGPWAEARAKLEASCADLEECARNGLKHLGLVEVENRHGEPVDQATYRRMLAQKRAVKALDTCLERTRIARAYLHAGEPALAATEVICATAAFSLACLPDAHGHEPPAPGTWSESVDAAKAGQGESPWVSALRTATKQIKALHPVLGDHAVRVPACVDPPALRPGPGRMVPVGTVLERAVAADPKAHAAGLAYQRAQEDAQRAANVPVRPRRRT